MTRDEERESSSGGLVTVTAIAEHPRRPGRYRVALDGAADLVVSVDLIAELKLKPGRVLVAGERSRLEQGARAIACYDKALATLSARARTAADLRRWLRTKEFIETEIAPAVEKLEALGLLDDREFARTFARSRLAPGRGFGIRRVAIELTRKGVARGIVDEVLAEYAEEREQRAEEAEAAGQTVRSAVEEAAAKKLRTLAALAPEVQRRRLYGFLVRRGFSSGEIAGVLRTISPRGDD